MTRTLSRQKSFGYSLFSWYLNNNLRLLVSQIHIIRMKDNFNEQGYKQKRARRQPAQIKMQYTSLSPICVPSSLLVSLLLCEEHHSFQLNRQHTCPSSPAKRYQVRFEDKVSENAHLSVWKMTLKGERELTFMLNETMACFGKGLASLSTFLTTGPGSSPNFSASFSPRVLISALPSLTVNEK